jgi:hypothetical protein
MKFHVQRSVLWRDRPVEVQSLAMLLCKMIESPNKIEGIDLS